MGDARQMNQAITDYLKQTLQGTVQDSHIYAMAMLITGLIRSKVSHFEQIGAKSGARAKPPSRVKQIHRFVKNQHVSYETHFMPFSQLVIASLGLTEFSLSIDSTQLGRGCMMLTLGLVYQKRVIPLVWTVYQGKKGHCSAEKQLALLEQVHALLPKDAIVILTGDAEFDGTAVISWLQAHTQWQYAIRTAKNILVRAGQDATQQPLQQLAPPAAANQLLTQLTFTQQEVGPVNLAFLWNQKEREHLYLVTSAPSLEMAQTWYQRRFKIETLFSDTKSRGFGLHKSGMRHPERLSRFVIAVFLAYIWMIYLGTRVIRDRKLGLVARTDRFMYSLFQLGRFYLDYILEVGGDIPVSFQLPHPDSFEHVVLV